MTAYISEKISTFVTLNLNYMTKLLVHFHLYYHDQTDYFLSKLANIDGCEWDMFVTMPQRDEAVEAKLRNFKNDVHIIEVENYGYDVWPFLKVIKSVNLDDYDYIIKLHTKRFVNKAKANKITMRGFRWRNEMVDALLSSREQFVKVKDMFDNDKSVGLVCSLLTYQKTNQYIPGETRLCKEFERLGLTPADLHFCAGTMFMAKASLYKILQREDITTAMFVDCSPQSGADLSMAHTYERILSMLPSAQGSRIVPICESRICRAYINAATAIQPFFAWIFTIAREGDNYQKYIRLFGLKFKLQ